MLDTAAILAGGFGTRLQLRSEGLPKCLMKFGNRTFISLQINWLLKQGFKRIYVCTGYKHDLIESYFRKQNYFLNHVELSKEPSPLGTGGAIKYLVEEKNIRGSLLVINGDTFFKFSINKRVVSKKLVDYSSIIWVSKVENDGRFALIDILGDRVVKYEEKGKYRGKFCSCGCYILETSILKNFGDNFSLENDLFPSYVNKEQVGCFKVESNSFYDFGTVKSFDSLDPEIIKWLS